MEEDTYIRYLCSADPDVIRRMVLQMPDIQIADFTQEETIIIDAKDALLHAIQNKDFPIIKKMF